MTGASKKYYGITSNKACIAQWNDDDEANVLINVVHHPDPQFSGTFGKEA